MGRAILLGVVVFLVANLCKYLYNGAYHAERLEAARIEAIGKADEHAAYLKAHNMGWFEDHPITTEVILFVIGIGSLGTATTFVGSSDTFQSGHGAPSSSTKYYAQTSVPVELWMVIVVFFIFVFLHFCYGFGSAAGSVIDWVLRLKP